MVGLLAVERLRGACVYCVYLRVFLAVTLSLALSHARGARYPVAKVVLVAVLPVLLVVLVFRPMVVLVGTAARVEEKLVERFACG